MTMGIGVGAGVATTITGTTIGSPMGGGALGGSENPNGGGFSEGHGGMKWRRM